MTTESTAKSMWKSNKEGAFLCGAIRLLDQTQGYAWYRKGARRFKRDEEVVMAAAQAHDRANAALAEWFVQARKIEELAPELRLFGIQVEAGKTRQAIERIVGDDCVKDENDNK